MSTQAEVAEKHAFVETLLAKDRFLSPPKVVDAVTKKFGTGISKAEVAHIRMEKHGIKLGPGGFATDKEGKRVVDEGRAPRQRGARKAVTVPPAGVEESNARLARMIGELRTEMQAQQVQELNILATGQVQAVQTVRRTMTIQ